MQRQSEEGANTGMPGQDWRGAGPRVTLIRHAYPTGRRPLIYLVLAMAAAGVAFAGFAWFLATLS